MERDCSDEHEEGEIVDDFEDISDYSMPSSLNSGKSVSHRDLLQDVSLSSISDNDPDALIYINSQGTLSTRHRKRKKKTMHYRRRKRQKPNEYYNRHKLNRYMSPPSQDSNSDRELDPKTQRQLKDAIHIERTHIHHNSLRTRLKVMLQNENVKDKSEDEDEETLRTLALLSHSKDDATDEGKDNNKINDIESADDKDEELIELRLAALKSAVLRKVPEIRKRKFKQQLGTANDQICEINKENDVNQENNIKEDVDNIKNTESVDFKIIHDDIDITKEAPKNISIEEDIDIMRAKLLASMSKKITSNVPKQNVTKISKETRLNGNIKLTTQQKYTFLKQQIKVKPIIINLNDSDSDTDITNKKDQNVVIDKDIHLVNSVSEFLKKQRAAVEAKTNVRSGAQDKPNSLDKSVLRLLPKSQQKEYHLLKQKLLMARKKRIRKNSQKNENKSVVTKKNAKESISKEEVKNQQQLESKPSGLQKALLDDLQIKRNGRLQMKGKYKALAPLLQKVNQASIERKQCELEIKTLLESLQKARNKLGVSHQNYTNLVMHLTAQKNAIDRRANKTHNMKVFNNNISIIKSTSTPIKCNIQESVCDISSIHNSQDNVKETDAISDNAQTEAKDIHLQVVCNNEPLPKCDNENNTLKQYVSPLDSKNRDAVEDPLTTFCPFELFGVCKDPECKFNHCSKT